MTITGQNLNVANIRAVYLGPFLLHRAWFRLVVVAILMLLNMSSFPNVFSQKLTTGTNAFVHIVTTLSMMLNLNMTVLLVTP